MGFRCASFDLQTIISELWPVALLSASPFTIGARCFLDQMVAHYAVRSGLSPRTTAPTTIICMNRKSPPNSPIAGIADRIRELAIVLANEANGHGFSPIGRCICSTVFVFIRGSIFLSAAQCPMDEQEWKMAARRGEGERRAEGPAPSRLRGHSSQASRDASFLNSVHPRLAARGSRGMMPG
jgi:hypothetical protein